MNFSNINKAFKEQWNFIPVTDDTDKGQLSELLNKSIQELKAKDTTDFNTYFTAFIEDIESVFPDAPWYNSVGLDIRNDLFNTQNPQITAEHILDSIIDASAYRNSELTEAANPDNAAINKVIYEVASGKSRAIKKLEKMGYEVIIDDSARKEFGRKYFGDTIKIINPKFIYLSPVLPKPPRSVLLKNSTSSNSISGITSIILNWPILSPFLIQVPYISLPSASVIVSLSSKQ